MQTEPGGESAAEEPVPDLEYDLAHETSGERAEPADRPQERIYVATQTDDSGGDYGYDLAHDVPRRG